MFDETHTTHDADGGTPRRSTAGQLRLQLPQQSAPVQRDRRPESGDASGGAAASGFLGSLLGDILPF
ncbi:hypothetical protein J7E93_06030 [Streptomyces sp. ISL-36]|uniref:hypothetical protein n=1 Tax=Streptomyces sp. ISL-36 TaxID=2819182 RepID=UPI001BEAD2BA|nr:hypothetical protein [Streptomyces sp. ISL-36]MBT2439686.1 hypothetical protein [Streptomyces sp. ISL-36]